MDSLLFSEVLIKVFTPDDGILAAEWMITDESVIARVALDDDAEIRDFRRLSPTILNDVTRRDGRISSGN
ncbi:hypothetical protein [Halorussus salinus]|uniref:hypothetical protein n=1 Tax=Halorussus salinus TaxID=1364935 RepID=UPI0010922B3B|nr:hypothetical protein [Halorussus salinus]